MSASGEEGRWTAPKREDGVESEPLTSSGLRVPADRAEGRQRRRDERQPVETDIAVPDRSRRGDSGSDSVGASDDRYARCISRAGARDRTGEARPLRTLRVARDTEEHREEEHRDDRGSGASRGERGSPFGGGSGTR
jgi:hypothetical protein